MKFFTPLLFVVLLLSGCATNHPYTEFVKTVNFSSLDTFSYKHTLVSGLEFRESEKLLLEAQSEMVLSSELEKRGFEKIDSGADFYVVSKWKQAVSSSPGIFDSIDGPVEFLDRKDHPGYKFSSRLHLTVEIYEVETGNLFWRAEHPNVFDSIQFSEERVIASLERAIRNFPDRIEKDPNLPSIE